MTLRIVLKSGYHFEIARADWKVVFDGIAKAVNFGNEKNSKVNIATWQPDDDKLFPLWLNIDEIAAFHPVAETAGYAKR
jgi:hypothetical protein